MPCTRPGPPPRSLAAAADAARDSLDDWMEQADEEARRLRTALPGSAFEQFRSKLAAGEALSRSTEKLAAAVRFTGRLMISFHQGRVTKTVLEESYSTNRVSAAT